MNTIPSLLRADAETPLALDYYLLQDATTGRLRFTRAGQEALAARFARVGIALTRLRTLDDVEDAIARVTHAEYHRLSPTEQDEAAAIEAIHDLDFITDRLWGRPLWPLNRRREQRRRALEHLLTAFGRMP